MKRIKDIFFLIADMDNLHLAHYNAKKGKRHYGEVIRVNKNEDQYLGALQKMILYCDDVVLLHEDKDYLQYCIAKIEYYLEKNLELKIKPNYQVYPIKKRRINFLGFMFDNNRAYLRKRIVKGFKKAARRYMDGDKKQAKGLASYYGWFKHSDSWSLWNKYVTDFKSIKKQCYESTIQEPTATN